MAVWLVRVVCVRLMGMWYVRMVGVVWVVGVWLMGVWRVAACGPETRLSNTRVPGSVRSDAHPIRLRVSTLDLRRTGGNTTGGFFLVIESL